MKQLINKFNSMDDSIKEFILMMSPFIGAVLGLIIVVISYLI